MYTDTHTFIHLVYPHQLRLVPFIFIITFRSLDIFKGNRIIIQKLFKNYFKSFYKIIYIFFCSQNI
ncbi:unnamed protein product [Meloidogyne enterolobii]|uniref:Uncharacterized protein n=1 Tax=Meloidogyne enterolobii TaxID=390850 RepID=A0ACB0XL88_MELEN